MKLLPLVILCAMSSLVPVQSAPPNVILILCDDLNDAVAGFGRVPAAATPNLDRLRAMGVTFTNASVNSPICLPSRSSMFSGLHPCTTDHYQLDDPVDENPRLRRATMLPALLRARGYATFGAGKVFHSGSKPFRDSAPTDQWDEFVGGPGYGPFPFNPDADHPTRKLTIHPRQAWLMDDPGLAEIMETFHDPFWMTSDGAMKFAFEHGFAPLEDAPPKGWHWPDGTPFRFVSDDDRDLLEDEKSARFACDILSRPHTKPFFLALGFVRPHTPLYVPKKYFDLFPPDSLSLPKIHPNGLAGTSPAHRGHRPYGRLRWEMLKPGGEKIWREWLQAYLASIAFVDHQLGIVLDALEKSSAAANTIIVFTSDNGYHMGDKENLFKDTLWEASTRVPLVIAGPGVARGGTSPVPVSLIDIYPTLTALCVPPADPTPAGLDGHSLVPLLRDPAAGTWSGPDIAVTGVRGRTGTHFAARSATHRYILCEDGSEELYDHRTDPDEHHNLAADPGAEAVKQSLRTHLKNFLQTCQNRS